MSDIAERRRLQLKNSAAWAGETREDLAVALDSSLKKNTAFIKKARLGLNQENLPSLLNDIKTLSLEKYLSEIVSAIAEGISKVRGSADIVAATEVVSSLHQRFAAQFTTVLAFQLVRALTPPPASHLSSLTAEQKEKDEPVRVNRQRNLIKIVTELWLAGVFRSIQDAIDGANSDTKRKRMEEPLPIFCLRELLTSDKDFTILSVATSFVKTFPNLLDSSQPNDVLEAGNQEKLFAMFLKYYQELARHLQRQNDYLNREKSRFEETTVAYGAAPGARELAVSELQKLHEKQLSAAQVLAEVLKQDTLILQDNSDSLASGPSMIRGVGGSKVEGDAANESLLWDDEEQRRFYEVLLDLGQVVPSDMLCEDKSSDSPSTKSVKTISEVEDDLLTYDDSDLEEHDNQQEEVEIPTTTIGVKVHNLVIRLPEMTNKESIDNCAIEFSFLNSKASRNRLIKALLDVNVNRTDLLPYYARLIATLNQHLESIAVAVLDHLHRECRRFTAGKGLRKDIPKRIFNIRFISELAKFGIVPMHITFHCFKIMLDSFTKFDVEVLASMLEHCGRYLLRSPATSVRMENVLAVIMRKAQNTSGVERTLIENAFYYVNPPEYAGIPQIERPTIELYIDRLIYGELSSRNYDQILKRLKKLDWNDTQISGYLLSIFISPWKLSYSSIQLLAVTLSGLAKLHPDFVMSAVDSTIEDIRLGLEENIFRENQQRVATVKYLGELFNCKVIDSKVILDTLYLCLSFGTPEGRPLVGGTVLDPGHDFFRIRLILTLMDTCLVAFSQGALRTKADLFLCFFQYYIKTKVGISRDIEYDIVRSLNLLRPALRICSTIEEASSELEEALSHSRTQKNEVNLEREDSISSGSSDNLLESKIEGSVSDIAASEHSNSAESDVEQEFVLLEKKREQDDLDKFAEEELDREFSKLMNESLEVRKQEIKKPIELPLPRRQVTSLETSTSSLSKAQSIEGRNDVDINSPKPAVKFTFLSRKSKPRSLDLPSDSPLALHNAAHRIAEEREKQTIRDLTLKYEVAQSREDLEDGLSRAGAGVKYLPIMLAGQKGGSRNGSIFKMGAREAKSVK